MLQYLNAKQLSPLAFLSVNNAYGDSGRREFEKAAGPAGIRVAVWEKFGASDKDMKPQLTRARSSGVKAIVVWAIPPAAAIVAKSGQAPSAIGGMAYDAMLLIGKALESAGTDRARLRDALERTTGIVGVTGVFHMTPDDHNGLGLKDLGYPAPRGATEPSLARDTGW